MSSSVQVLAQEPSQPVCDPGILLMGEFSVDQAEFLGTVFGRAIEVGKANFVVVTCFNGVEKLYFGYSPDFE